MEKIRFFVVENGEIERGATRSFWKAKVFMRNFLRFNRRNTALSRSWVASRLKLENFFKKPIDNSLRRGIILGKYIK